MLKTLTTTDHNRNVSGLRYVYPVISRRAGGLSIGINLNINNACNWRCIYCNVPNLTRGTPPPIDLKLLENEFKTFLNQVVHGDFMDLHVKVEDRKLKDIAFSGNGEPTSAKEFTKSVILIQKVLNDFNLLNKVKVRLITNGSLMNKQSIIDGIHQLAQHSGEVWFKLDAASADGIAIINDISLNPSTHIDRLIRCATVCPTFIQTCFFALDGHAPSENEIEAYIKQVIQVKDCIQGVHLYGIARQSMQIEAPRLSQLSLAWFQKVAYQIEQHGITVHTNP